MTLIMRKLLASSTFAIAGALDSLARKLERQLRDDKNLREKLEEEIAEDYEEFDEVADEWEEEEIEPQLLTADGRRQHRARNRRPAEASATSPCRSRKTRRARRS